MQTDQHTVGREERFFAALLKHRLPVLVVMAVVLLFLGAGLPRLEVDFNIESLFPRDDARKTAFRHFQNLFGRDDDLILLILQAEDPLHPGFLMGLDTLASAVQKLDFAAQAYSLLDVLECRPTDDMEVTIVPLRARVFPPDHPEGLNLSAKERLALQAGPFRNFVNEPERSVTLVIRLKEECADNQGRLRAMRELRKFMAGRSFRGLRGYLFSGLPAIRAEGMELIQRDQARLLPLSALATLIVFFLIFGRAREVVLVLLNTAAILVVTFGTMGHLGLRFSLLSSVTPIILIITSTTYSIHPLTRIRLAGDPREPGAISRLFAEMNGALLFCCLTTCTGFLSLITIDVDLISEFAWITAGGVLTAYLASVTLLPLLTMFGAPDTVARRQPGGLQAFRGLIWWLCSWAFRGPRMVVTVGVLLGLAGAMLTSRLAVRAFVFDDFWPDSEFMRSIRQAERVCHGLLPLSVTIQNPGKEAVLRSHFLRKAVAMRNFLAAQDGVTQVDAVTDTIGDLWRIFSGQSGGIASGSLPPDDSSLGNVLRFLLVSGTVDPGFGLVSSDLSALQIKARLRDLESQQAIALIDRVREFARTLEDDRTVVRVTGTTVMILESYRSILRNFSSSIAAVVGVTMLLFLARFPHLRILGIALVGNLAPLGMTFGLMNLLDIPIKNSTIVIFGIALGLAVDDTIHFLHHFRLALKRGLERSKAARQTILRTGQGMIVSSLALIAGFVVLLFSEFEAQYLIGFLLSFNVAMALVFDLLFVPAAVQLWGPRRAADFW